MQADWVKKKVEGFALHPTCLSREGHGSENDSLNKLPCTRLIFHISCSTPPFQLIELHLPHSTVALLLSHVPVDVVARNIQLILVGKGFQVMFSGVVQVWNSRERRGGGTFGRSASWHFVSWTQKMSGSSRLTYSIPPF